MKEPLVSFVIATYNGERTIKGCLDSIFSQKYKNKEVIVIDGGSSDRTLEIVKKYKIKLLHNKFKLSEGPGMGKSQGGKKARGKFICYVDQDNILIGENWISEILKPFKDKKVAGVASKLAVIKNDKLINRYLSLVGTDPFAAYYSLEGQLELRPEIFESKDGYLIFSMNKNNVLCAGNNGFVYRREYFDKIRGYTRDTDMMQKLANMNLRIGVALKAKTHHLTVSSLMELIRKRRHYINYYFNTLKNNREFSWIPSNKNEKRKLSKWVLKNLFVFPNTFFSIKKFIKTKETAWLLHSIVLFITTLVYITSILENSRGRKLFFEYFKR